MLTTRTIRTALGAAALVAALAACSQTGGVRDSAVDGPDRTAARPSLSAPASPTPDPDQEFLSAVHDADFESWKVEGQGAPTDDELLAFPPKWCEAAALGHSVGWMLQGSRSGDFYPVGLNWGTQIDDARELVVMAVSAYCPDYRDQVIQSWHDGTTEY